MSPGDCEVSPDWHAARMHPLHPCEPTRVDITLHTVLKCDTGDRFSRLNLELCPQVRRTSNKQNVSQGHRHMF